MSDLLLNRPWEPPPPPSGDELVQEVDPRVEARHAIGALPCPNNPPPPVGWAYREGDVPGAARRLAATMLHDATAYPMGCFVQARLDGALVGARVEWHTVQGSTGKTGCFRGVSLMQRTAAVPPGEAMPSGRPAPAAGRYLGVDSLAPVTPAAVTLAEQLLGEKPLFWGRYFSTPTTGGSGEYRHNTESATLRVEKIRLLPIARQTKHVAGSEADGEGDGRANAADLVATFGHDSLVEQGELFLFLDVEGEPSLSADYYRGWCKGLASVAPAIMIRPCVYANKADGRTWAALNNAAATGAPCHGLWVAHWPSPTGPRPPAWSARDTTPEPGVSAHVLLWQYAGNAGGGRLDCSQANPALDLENVLLRYLILPA
jgi:hypothetical protein